MRQKTTVRLQPLDRSSRPEKISPRLPGQPQGRIGRAPRCLFLVVIVLLQHGKGADVGATFGGSGQSLFGTEGPVPLMNKVTTGAAILFMATSISLAYISSHRGSGSVMSDSAPPPIEQPLQAEGPKTIPMPDALAPGDRAPAEFPGKAVENTGEQQQ